MPEMMRRDRIRLDRAAFMTDIGCRTQLYPMGFSVLSWESMDDSVAAVDPSGLVTATGNGDTRIIAHGESGVRVECIVSVGYPGGNPLLPPTWGLFIADGEPHAFGDRLYIYGSHDNAFGKNAEEKLEWCSSDYHVIWTEDLIHWTDAGVSISVEDFPDELRFERGRIDYLWAPDLFKAPDKNKYYLAFCTGGGLEGCYIAEGEDPAGPFGNVRKLTYQGEHIKVIDPGVLTDDDGRVYIALPAPFRLGELDPETNYSSIIDGSVISLNELVADSPDGHYGFEGPSLRKFGGRYYYIYIASQKDNRLPVRMNYLISENIREGWRFGGTIIDTREYLTAINVHGSVEFFKGKYLLSYHRPVPGVSLETAPGEHFDLTREMCIEKIEMRPDGTFVQSQTTSSGVSGSFGRGRRIQAGSAAAFSGGRGDERFVIRGNESSPGSNRWSFTGYAYTYFSEQGQWNSYRFAELTGCGIVRVSVCSTSGGNVLEFTGVSDESGIARIELPDTFGEWVTIEAPLLTVPEEPVEFKVCLKTKPEPGSGPVYLDWIEFV